MYLAFDPGETTGVAEFNSNGEIVAKWQLDFVELVEFLRDHKGPTAVVICEEFKVFGHKAKGFTNDRMEVSQAVGVIRAFAMNQCAEFVYQPPLIKSVAEKWTGVKVKGAHKNTHWQDAFLHGAYYLIVNKIRRTELEMSEEKRRNEASNKA